MEMPLSGFNKPVMSEEELAYTAYAAMHTPYATRR